MLLFFNYNLLRYGRYSGQQQQRKSNEASAESGSAMRKLSSSHSANRGNAGFQIVAIPRATVLDLRDGDEGGIKVESGTDGDSMMMMSKAMYTHFSDRDGSSLKDFFVAEHNSLGGMHGRWEDREGQGRDDKGGTSVFTVRYT